MRFAPLLAALLALPLALVVLTQPAVSTHAQTVKAGAKAGDDAERARMEALIRDYLLANPEIIPEAMSRLQEREVTRTLDSNRAEIETPFPGAEIGNPKGDVTVVEFFDFQCPYCKASHNDAEILVRNDGNVRYVFRDLPVLDRGGEPISMRSALAALAAARQGKYLALRKALFDLPGRPSQERLVQAIRAAGLDEARLARDMEDPALKQALDANIALAQNIGVTGTPTFIIGNQLFAGGVGIEGLSQAVNIERARRNQR